MMTETDGIAPFPVGDAPDTRLVIAQLDEVARLRPDVPRVELIRAITGRRNFEVLLMAGRVSPRKLEELECALTDWLGQGLTV